MALISVNIEEVESLRSVFWQRVGDLHAAHDHVRRVRDALAVNFDDPDGGVRSLPAILASIEQRLTDAANAVDAQQRGVDRFIAGAVAIDGRATGFGMGLVDLAGRLGRDTLRDAGRLFRFEALSEVRGIEALALGAGEVLRSGFSVLRATTRFAVHNGESLSTTIGRTLDRYITQPFDRMKQWLHHGWHAVSDAFRRSWDVAWSKLQTITRELADVGRASWRAGSQTMHAVGLMLGKDRREVTAALSMRFPTIKEHRFVDGKPAHAVGPKTDLKATLSLDLHPVLLGVKFTGTLTASVQRFNDGTAEVTIGREFATELAVGLDFDDAATKAKVEAAIEAAFGDSRTFIIPDTMIGDQSAINVFIEQEAARILMQALATTGGPTGLLAAYAMRHVVAPEPSPSSSTYYLDVKETGTLAATAGATGASLSGSEQMHLEATMDADRHLTSVSATETVDAEAAGKLLGTSAGAGTSASMTFKVSLDSQGQPTSLDVSLANEAHKSVGINVGGASASSTLDDVATRSAHIDISPADRAEIGQLVHGLPGSADVLARDLAKIGSGATLSGPQQHEYQTTEGSATFDGGIVEGGLSKSTRTQLY